MSNKEVQKKRCRCCTVPLIENDLMNLHLINTISVSADEIGRMAKFRVVDVYVDERFFFQMSNAYPMHVRLQSA